MGSLFSSQTINVSGNNNSASMGDVIQNSHNNYSTPTPSETDGSIRIRGSNGESSLSSSAGASNLSKRKPITADGTFVCQKLAGRQFSDAVQAISPKLFKNTTSSAQFCDNLYALRAITSVDKQTCEALTTDYGKNKFLYEKIFRTNAINSCIVALEESENDHIITLIREQIQ